MRSYYEKSFQIEPTFINDAINLMTTNRVNMIIIFNTNPCLSSWTKQIINVCVYINTNIISIPIRYENNIVSKLCIKLFGFMKNNKSRLK